MTIDIRDFGGTTTGNNTPALNAAVIAAIAANEKKIHFPASTWRFDSEPAAITHGIRLIGDGQSYTQLHRNFNGGTFLNWNGVGGAGGGVEKLMVYSSAGRTGGTAINFYANANNNSPDFSVIEDTVVTGNGTWDYGLVLWGQDRTAGLRDFDVRNLNVLNCNYATALLYRAIGFRMTGGFFQGGGSTSDIVVNYGSDGVRIDKFGANVQVANSQNVWVNGEQKA